MDPYKVWLSEVMLQQTTVATVIPRFIRFVERWPSIGSLAAATDEEILGEWAGLGYYARARNLIACARAVVARGGFPTSERELRALPGAGDYTAAAIAAIAFGHDSTPIDTNVERVVARLQGLTDKASIRAAAIAMTPSGQAGNFAQALMDLGASLCRPKNPDCQDCPLRAECIGFLRGCPEAYPAPKVKKARPHRHGVALWYQEGESLFLVRRPDKGMLGGMAALPGDDWASDSPPSAGAITTVSHGFTHFTLDLHVIRAEGSPKVEGWWHELDRIGQAGLPTLFSKAVAQVRSRERQ